MKKFMIALAAFFLVTVTAKAMSYEQARQQALFLADKMAYELNLTEDQYEAVYEINLDYLMGVNSYDDVYGVYWDRRNIDLGYVLLDWQYRAFCAASYFYRPLYWNAGYWHFAVYSRYPRRDYFYFGRPHFWTVYRGGHSWHHNGGRSWYNGREFGHRRGDHGGHFGMQDGFKRGDYRHGFDNHRRHDNHDNHGVRPGHNGVRPNDNNVRPNGNHGVRPGGNADKQNGTTTRPSTNRGNGNNAGVRRGNNNNFGNATSRPSMRESSTRQTVMRPQRQGSLRDGGASPIRQNTTPSRSFTPSRSTSTPSGTMNRSTGSMNRPSSSMSRSADSMSRPSGSHSGGSRSVGGHGFGGGRSVGGRR